MKDQAVDPIIRDFVRNQTDIKIDKYSKGGFGELYFGERVILKDRVALKFYELDETEDNVHEEPQLLREITHENIIPIIDARILADEIAYYLTPEISGGDLQNIIDNYILPTKTAISMIQGVLKGLNELHKDPNNLVHRDLKTANILIDEKTEKAYLADFGTVKKIPDGKTNVGASKYTFIYRATEVVISNTYTKQSDIYQIGIVLFQALGGSFPLNNPENWLKGRSQLKYSQLGFIDRQIFLNRHIEDLIVKGKLLDLDSLPIYINKKMRSIIRTAIHPDSQRRYQSCSEFLRALYDYQKNEKDWWEENDIPHAYCKKKKRFYRVVQRKTEKVVEDSSDKRIWRKKFTATKLKELVNWIEKQ